MPFASRQFSLWRRRGRDLFAHCVSKAPVWLQRLHGHVRRNWLGQPVPRFCSIACQHLEKTPGEGHWLTIFPHQACTYDPPITVEEDSGSLNDLCRPSFAATGIAELNDAEIIGQHGLPFTRSGVLLSDLCFYEATPPPEAYVLRAPKEWRMLAGRTLNLATPYASINYGHALLDCLPRLHLLRLAKIDLSTFDHVILPAMPFKNVQAALLGELGIAREKVVLAMTDLGYRCEKLVQPSHPCGVQAPFYPPWIRAALPQALTPVPARSGRRVYLARGPGRRNLLNEAEVAACCAEFGFECVASSSLRSPGAHAQLFSECSAVISPHGAALTDVLFMPPGGTVVELSPSDWIRPYFYTLAAGCGQRYASFLTKSDGIVLSHQEYTTSVIADLSKLRHLLKKLFPPMTDGVLQTMPPSPETARDFPITRPS